jgi:heme/copper-type cytochrome/quinol oxidase subunit 2
MTTPSGEGLPRVSSGPADAATKSRDLWSRIVFVGMVLFIIGFIAVLMAQSVYPCTPAAGHAVEPPLTDCALFLSPWVVLAVFGLVLFAVAYLRVG